MGQLKNFLEKDALQGFSKDLDARELEKRFGSLLPKDGPRLSRVALFPFVKDIPFRYWNRSLVLSALEVLRRDRNRSINALKLRSMSLDSGFQNLFHLPPVAKQEVSVQIDKSQDLVSLATEYMPDYLRWAEHVYGKLLEFYWSVLKKGSPKGKFDIRGALALVNSKGLAELGSGFSENFRNSIAHGNFSFSGFDIEFGSGKLSKVTSYDFLRMYDELIRTTNGLAVALIIFCIELDAKDRISIPIGLANRFVSGEINRDGLTVSGSVVSESPLIGRQLHVLVSMETLSRTQVLLSCARIALYFYRVGVVEFDRLLLQIDQGQRVNSQVIIKYPLFCSLIDNDEELERLSEALPPDQQLLWFNESRWKARLKTWKTIIRTGLIWVRDEIHRRWENFGVVLGRSQYKIREVQEIAHENRVNVWVRVVLRSPEARENNEMLKNIALDIVQRFRKRRFGHGEGYMGRGIFLPRKPSKIFINVFAEDGSLRWLKGGGWQAGNLLLAGEYSSKSSDEPVFILDPEEVFQGVRLRFSMNKERAEKAAKEAEVLILEAWRKARMDRG